MLLFYHENHASVTAVVSQQLPPLQSHPARRKVNERRLGELAMEKNPSHLIMASLYGGRQGKKYKLLDYC